MEPITITIAEFCRYSGLRKTKTHSLIREGRLQIAKVGRRTLITVESARELIEHSLVKKGV